MASNAEVDDDDVLESKELAEAGALEADVGARFDVKLATIEPSLRLDMDPMAHQPLRPEMMWIREELRQAKLQTLALSNCPLVNDVLVQVRRVALKKLLLNDFLQEDCELRNFGLSYASRDL